MGGTRIVGYPRIGPKRELKFPLNLSGLARALPRIWRNAEYKLCLERNVEIYEGHVDKSHIRENSKLEMEEKLPKINGTSRTSKEERLPMSETTIEITSNMPDFGEITPEAREYILRLHSYLSSMKKV